MELAVKVQKQGLYFGGVNNYLNGINRDLLSIFALLIVKFITSPFDTIIGLILADVIEVIATLFPLIEA